MKKFIALFSVLLSLFAALFLAACTGDAQRPDQTGPTERTEITLWTFPVGGWGNSNSISHLLAAFHRDHPEVHVSIEHLEYTTGDDKIAEAAKNHTLPDLVFEGPERLVATWAAQGMMVDISDLWTSDVSKEIDDSIKTACGSGGKYYTYPLCMTTHCMAINYDMFKEADALKYIDEETHTWTTDGFVNAVNALYEHGIKKIATVYCDGQAGDQGTRALVNNLYSGTFTDAAHTRYTVDSDENIRALELLKNLNGISFDSDVNAIESIDEFCAGESAMAFCWNVFNAIDKITNSSIDFNIFPMAFPTDNETVNLQYGIWGFGIFDNDDADRIEASKTFIRYINENEDNYRSAVLISNYWPVREIPDLYANYKLMDEYRVFNRYVGDYYQITPGWADARKAWWTMLSAIGAGSDVTEAVAAFSAAVNK